MDWTGEGENECKQRLLHQRKAVLGIGITDRIKIRIRNPDNYPLATRATLTEAGKGKDQGSATELK